VYFLRRPDPYFFVDAIQQAGALSLDVLRAKIDVLAADAHKWLLGPEGIAVFYCRESARERLQLTQFGWRMVDNPYGFDRSS
jgi:selenocysteine lyase/cysteine desulfurase